MILYYKHTIIKDIILSNLAKSNICNVRHISANMAQLSPLTGIAQNCIIRAWKIRALF